ncbi:unnamed protein product [Parnassius apollo]|uniref:(apollo) hypothetical protein n=1 Tax=Parnassius apollo TaxID=110799 RepID=A0A8S3X3Z9_PARAO|nr:unnamed protein product [Parnassius apollo]
MTRNARAIVEGSRDAGERQLVQSTVTALSDQFAAICSELEARQAAVEDACDAVARFLALLEKVLLWVETQRAFLARPLPLADLQEAQQKQTEYGNALKSCKQQAKNLADMAKEIEAIERVTSPGDLPSRLEAAENATVDVEKKLAKTNGLLQELAEEWERCEKKLKDVGHWLEATTRTIEAPQNAKKPLRDRLALREKLINDISTQKTKISYAVEKLDVHFGPDGVASQSRSPEGVQRAARELCSSLDSLGGQTAAQARQLTAALQQLDAYCVELAQLRSQLLDAEQQLRHVAQPNYSPRDPERAQRQQQEAVRRIEELTRCIYEVDPYFAGSEDAAALSLLLRSGGRARELRRPRSPRRHSPPPGPAPLPHTTYAEIVRGLSSRSSSVGSRQPSAHRVPALDRPEPAPAEEERLSETYVHMPNLDSEMVNQPSDLYSEPIYENVSESETCKPDVDIHLESNFELIEYCDTEQPVDDQQKLKLQSLECRTSAQSDPIHDVLRPPEYHDRSLSPATRLRSQDLSYAEILALGLGKQAKAQNIITLPKPQVAEVEMVKEIIVEVEKAPPIIHCEPRVQPTDSSRIKLERPERPFQRSRSRDMPRQRRAPEKRSTKSHDMQTIKKKKTSKRVIEVENFDDSPDTTEPTTKSSDTCIYRAIEKFEEPKPEKSCKEITKKVHHSATVVETVVETVSEEVPQESLKTELEQKKPKKKNKHKKVKGMDDEIEKALKEIEESDRHKKRKTKDSRDKSKEIITGAESDETEQRAEVTKKSLEAMADNNEVTNKQKKKKIHKDSKTSKLKEEKSETNIHLIQSTDEKATGESSNLGEETGPIVKSDDSDNYNLVEPGGKYSSVIKNKKGNFNENVSDIKSANEATGNVGKEANKVNQNEMNTQSVTTSFTKTKEEHDDLKNEESDAEKASKHKKKKKGKKQGQSPEHNEQKLMTTEVAKTTFEESMKIIEPINEKISNVVKKTEEIKLNKQVALESSDSIKEKVQLGNTPDRSKPNDDVESIHPKKKLKSKKQKFTESKNPSQEQSFSEALGTTHIILEDKSVENIEEEEFMEVKANRKKLKSKKLKELEKVASSEKLKEKCVELIDKQRQVSEDTTTIEQSKKPITEEDTNLIHREISQEDQEVQSDLVNMDWNTLMAEEENVLESEVAQIKKTTDETDASQTTTQVATEVTILPEISNIMNMKPKSEQLLENVQMKEMVENEMSSTSSPNEQNNNDKIFSSDLLKNSPLNIVEEITRYEPIVQDIKTRTIYLITHEEKKLPPIRTVKVFSTKSNLETETQGESTSDTIDTFVHKDNKIVDKHISRSTSENVEDVVEGQISTDCIEEFPQYAQDPNLNTEAEKYCLEQFNKVNPPHGFIENPKSIDDDMIIGQEKLENVKNLSNSHRSTLTTNEEGDNFLHLDAKHDYSVVPVSNQMEEFSENLLEHAIFGSVQDRKKPTFIKTSSIPYQELVEEIKTYSLNLDIDQLDFDYHRLMIDEEGEVPLNVDIRNDVVKQRLDDEITKNDIVEKDSTESHYEKSAKETAAMSLNMSNAPHFNYHEMKDAEKSFASLMTTVTDLKCQEEENKNIDQNSSNLLKTFAADAVACKNDSQDNADSIIKENKPSDITPIPLSEINIDASHALTIMQTTDNSLIKKTQAEDNKAVNLIESTKSKEIGVVLNNSKFEERKMADNIILNILHDDITYFNYSAIADSEKLLASYIDCHVKTVSEDEKYKTVFPIPSVNQNDRNLVSIPNEFDIQEEKLKLSGNANCDNEVVTTSPNIQNESELKAVVLSKQNDIYKPKQTITLLLENLRQELPRFSHYDILDAEKIYPSLINVCDLNRNVTAPGNINAAVDTDTLIKNNNIVLHQQSVDLSKENIENVNYINVLHYEIPKYDYYERNKSEALLASVEQYAKELNKVLLEEPKTITDSDSHTKVKEMASKDDSIQQSGENTAFNNVPVQNYHEICDAENLYASTLIMSENQYLTSRIDENIPSSGKDEISLTTGDNDKKLLDITVKTNTSDIKSNPDLEINAENFVPENTDEIENECKEISQTDKEFSKESIHEITLVRPLKTYIDFYETPNFNYMQIREAEGILARMATVLFITSLEDNKQHINFTENKSVVNVDEIKRNPEESIEFDVINKIMNKPEAPVMQEFSDSLVPVVFGNVSEISKLILDKETNLTKSQKKDLDDTNKDSTTMTLIKDTVEDFVIVENLQNISTIAYETDSTQKFDVDQNTSEELDFEQSFEVIDIMKDISCEMKCLDRQSILPEKSEILSITEVNDASSLNKTVQEDSSKENVQERAESPKPENKSQTIASKMSETDITSSVCMTQDSTDLKDTHEQSSNVTSTDPYVDISTDISSDVVSDQSVLTETATNNNTRPEKSPIHSLHDLLPEIDSIPEFKPSFSNTILFSKLSADAPEFTPSYMYQTGDNQLTSIPIPSLSNTQQLLQTDERQAGFTTVPVTYSSVLLSQKDKVESADN